MTRGRIPPPRSAVLICRKNDEHSEALPDRICEPLVGTLSDAYLLQLNFKISLWCHRFDQKKQQKHFKDFCLSL